MVFLWPGFLLLLGLIPILIGVYIWILRRRRPYAVRYSSLSLVREALAQQSRWRRHVPFGLFLASMAGLSVAMARPASIVSIPSDRTTIILSLDVSRSMCSTDIKPHRFQVMKDVAIDFIRRESNRQIGIVAFSGFAEIIQPPISDPEVLEDAVASLITGSRTAIGSGILRAIDAIAEVDPNVPKSVTSSSAAKPVPVPKGTYVPHIIVLLTDGASNAGPLPVDAAQQAIDRGIRVYTIGFGTENGAEFANCDPQLVGREPTMGGMPPPGGGFGFGGGGSGGGRFRRGIDEVTLKKVAEIADGKYYSAESASELSEVFKSLPTHLITKTETTEISFAFVTLGALLAALAIALSLLWHPLT